MIALLVFCFALVSVNVEAQTASPTDASRSAQSNDSQKSQDSDAPASPTSQPASPQTAGSGKQPSGSSEQKEQEGWKPAQSDRMFGVVPNFAAVSPGVKFKPLTVKEKFKIATEDSFDYSAFAWTGILAVQSMGLNTYPEFGKGATAYGRYYWHGFIDGVSGTYFTEAIVPVLTHQDPRYFTKEHGGFFYRLGFALSRTVVCNTDSGGLTFNTSELGGNAAEAALAQLYYPSQERGFKNFAINWGDQIESAALNHIAQEFWPDIRHYVFRKKD